MSSKAAKWYLGTAVLMTIICIGQIILALRYVERLPGDTLGIALSIIICVLFGVLAAVYYGRWMANRK